MQGVFHAVPEGEEIQALRERQLLSPTGTGTFGGGEGSPYVVSDHRDSNEARLMQLSGKATVESSPMRRKQTTKAFSKDAFANLAAQTASERQRSILERGGTSRKVSDDYEKRMYALSDKHFGKSKF